MLVLFQPTASSCRVKLEVALMALAPSDTPLSLLPPHIHGLLMHGSRLELPSLRKCERVLLVASTHGHGEAAAAPLISLKSWYTHCALIH